MEIQLINPHITEEDKECVIDALNSGWINNTGCYIDRFESLLAQNTKCKYAVSLNSGTSALFMALKAVGVKSGSVVAVPSITYVATINAIIHCGAKPIFFDCDQYLNINIKDLKEYLLSDFQNPIDCILPVHIFGNPCNIKEINKLAKSCKVKVVVDSCEALGSIYNKKNVCEYGDINVLSFSFNKMITSGNGGAIVTNNKLYANNIRYWIRQSKDNLENYIHNEVGYNLGLSNILAALGYSQLSRLKSILKEKARILQLYKKRLGNKIIYTKGGNAWLIAYKTDKRTEIQKTLHNRSIETRRLWRPNHLQNPFRYFKTYGTMKNSIKAYETIINLPCSTDLRNSEINIICDIIIEAERN